MVEYIELGHGAKGRQTISFMMTAISQIYNSYTKGERRVYCSATPLIIRRDVSDLDLQLSGMSSSKLSTGTSSPVSSQQERFSGCHFQKLRDKHQDKFTPPQLNKKKVYHLVKEVIINKLLRSNVSVILCPLLT